MNLLTVTATWTGIAIPAALLWGAVVRLADQLDRGPHDSDVPDTVPAEWVTA